MKKETVYIMYNIETGHFWTDSINLLRRDCIKSILSDTSLSWKQLRGYGWRARRAIITIELDDKEIEE